LVLLCRFMLALLLACATPPVWALSPSTSPAVGEAEAFDAAKAWPGPTSFLLSGYGFLDRPGISSASIFAYFEPIAITTATKEDFLSVLKQATRNFADPHLVSGPSVDRDYSLIPASSDIHATLEGMVFAVVDERSDRSALSTGNVPGDRIHAIVGLPADHTIEVITGRKQTDLSNQQQAAGRSAARAGVREASFTTTVRRSGHRQHFILDAATAQAIRVEAGPKLKTFQRRNVSVVRRKATLDLDWRTVYALLKERLWRQCSLPKLINLER
jgi:hypothetical protein